MSIITAHSFSSNKVLYVIDNLFTLCVTQSKSSTKLLMQVLVPITTTESLPSTHAMMKKMLPSILSSTCFNEEGLPFKEEVKTTEIGHLFEHILLEYLCEAKLDQGYEEAIFSGRTNWNWKNDQRGVFHIVIDAGYEENIIFPKAVEKSIRLLKLLFVSNHIGETTQKTKNLSLPSFTYLQKYFPN